MAGEAEELRTLTVYSKEQHLETKYTLTGSVSNFVAVVGGNAMFCEVSGGNWKVFSEPNYRGDSYIVHPGGSYISPPEKGMPATGAASAQLA